MFNPTYKTRSSKNQAPAVSVVIPAYKAAKFVAEALDSVFAQTFRDFEVLVVNDGSPDTSDLEDMLLNYDNRIYYIKQENRGPGGARNTGMRHAQGRYLAFLDSDDVWLPDFLADLFGFLEQNPSVDLVCSDCIFFGNPSLDGKSWHSLYRIDEPVTFEKILGTYGGAFPSFVLMRRDTALKVGFFDETLRLLEDYHYWLRVLYSGGEIVYLRKLLGRRRVHSDSLSHDQNAILPHAVKALTRLAAILHVGTPEAALLQKELAFARSRLALREGRQRLQEGDFCAASDRFMEANIAVPSRKIQVALFGLRWAPRWTRWAISHWDRHTFRLR